MNSDDDRSARRGYHHGNLREALVDAAIRLIAGKGLAGFTFADAARAVGVSPAAPYRHFRDRDALMSEVCRHGFQRLAERLDRAWDESRPNPIRALVRIGDAYLAFAREERPLFAAMFSSTDPQARAELDSAAAEVLEVLNRAAAALLDQLPPARRPPERMVSHHVWALSHGVAELLVADARPAPISPEEMLESGLTIYLRGLGIVPAEDSPDS